VSGDGMLANADRVMPEGLKFEGDKKFFTDALDHADLIVHGRIHSRPTEFHRSASASSRPATSMPIAPDPSNPNPRCGTRPGARLSRLRTGCVASGTVAIIGGPYVFGMFMDRYDTFWLSLAPTCAFRVASPASPVWPDRSPQQILAAHGLRARRTAKCGRGYEVSVTPLAAQRLTRTDQTS